MWSELFATFFFFDIHYHSGQNVVDSWGAAEWVCNTFWVLWWRYIVVDKSTDYPILSYMNYIILPPCIYLFKIMSISSLSEFKEVSMHRHEVVVLISLLYLLVLDVEGLCPPNTQCFGNGNYNAKAQSCKCYSRRRIGSFTGECCESVDCKPNATCVHGFCGADGLTCKRCLTGWTGLNCEKVDSCFPWLHCVHGSCKKSRMKCECEPGWVGDLCDRSLCTVNCTYGACPNDPKKCECYENFYSPETGCDRYCLLVIGKLWRLMMLVKQ